MKAIINGKVFVENEFVEGLVIVAENGIIQSVQKEIPTSASIVDLKGAFITPGFIDIQINGGEKFYFSQTPTEEALHDICDTSLRYCTTYTLPCLISSPKEKILEAIEVVGNFMSQHNKGILGMHLEGPFLHPDKRGAHNKEVIRKPTNHELEEIIRYGKDIIKVMTIAPEQFSDDQIKMLQEAGIILSAGHSTMSYVQAQDFFRKGNHLVTHLYNAMTQMGHREPGIVGAVLDNEKIFAPIILDGAHCDYAVARIAYGIKKEKLFLISDAAVLGRKLQKIECELLTATLENGFYRNNEGNLAGSAISMIEAVQNAIQHLSVSLETAISMATINVAKAIKMENKIGKIEKNYPATFIYFDSITNAPKTLLA